MKYTGQLYKMKEYDIKLLADIRHSGYSWIEGFRRVGIKSRCWDNRIEYRHFPILGIPSDKRRTMPRRAVLEYYRETILPSTAGAQQFIVDLMADSYRIALMCMEADYQLCHRQHLADALAALCPEPVEIIHL